MSFLKKFNFPILIPVFLLAVFSLLTLASLSANDAKPFYSFKKQLTWYILGVGIFLFLGTLLDHRILQGHNFFPVGFYVFCLFLLLLTLFFGIRVKGTSGWLGFSFFRFQPAEIAKLALIILLSKYFASWHIEIWRPQRLLVSAIYAGLFFGLTLLQPDLGSAIMFIFIWLGMLLVSGLRFKHFIIFCLIGMILIGLGWQYILHDYQKDRILGFFNPGRDPLGSGYNVIQAKIAIGSGGFFGRGLGQGVETQMRFLPEAKTDFFLAAFVEEWGLFGGILLFAVFVMFILQLVNIGMRADDNFSRLFVFGYLLLLVTQIFINFGANLGFLPVTGLPLPFLSYGGSSLLINFIALGIIQSIRMRSV